MASETLKIIIVTDGAQKASQQIQQVTDAVGKSQTAGLTGAVVKGNLATEAFLGTLNLLSKGLGMVTQTTQDFTVSSIKQASSLQDSVIGFRTMLGSAEKARTLLQSISEYAERTPFEFSELQEISKRLLAVGYSAKEILPTLDILGNISAGVGREKLPFLTLALSQVRTAGRLTGAELRQFSENQVPLLEELAKTMGKTTAEVQQMISNRKVTYQDVEKALKSLVGTGGRFNNLMGEQSKTLSGTTERINDIWKSFMRLFGGIRDNGDLVEGGILDMLQQQLAKLHSWMEANRERISSFFEMLGVKGGQMIEWASKKFEEYAPKIWAQLQEIKKQIQESGLIDSLKGLAKEIAQLIKEDAIIKLKSLTDSAKAFVDYLGSGEGQNKLRTFAGVLDKIASAANTLYQKLELVYNTSKALLPFMQPGGLLSAGLNAGKAVVQMVNGTKHDGGLVHGASGKETPILAQGGEYVLPRDVVDRIKRGDTYDNSSKNVNVTINNMMGKSSDEFALRNLLNTLNLKI